MEAPIKIVLADDHRLFRDGVKSLLAENEDFHIINEVADGEELLAALEKEVPDILLLDITMPKMSGLSVIKSIRQKFPKIGIIFLTMHADSEYIMEAVRQGAKGYLLKNTETDELEKAIMKVYKGDKYFNRDVSALLFEEVARSGTNTVGSGLSGRELEVLKLVAKGQSTKLIAEELSISYRTVETHRMNMMKKLDVNNSAELIQKAYKLDLLS